MLCYKLVQRSFFWLKELKTICRGYMLLVILTEKNIVGTFYEKELQKINQKEHRIEKAIKRKGNKLYVQWKS